MKVKKKYLTAWTCRLAAVAGAAALALSVSGIAFAAVAPPDTTVCDGVDACDAPNPFCDASGFTITLTNYTPAPPSPGGTASYTYTICAPAFDGVCSNIGGACQDNEDCNSGVKCNNSGPNANKCSNNTAKACTTDEECYVNACTGGSSSCRVDKFQALSHADVAFPELGNSCLGESTIVSGSCSNGNFVIGDGSCDFGQGQGPYNFVAKCDNTTVGGQGGPQCLTMTVNIPGELNAPGLGAAIVVAKESTSCTASCIQGPSCDPCAELPPGGACLTRTLGFWGTHPWITNDYDPVTVCGVSLSCSGASDGKSDPTCLAGSCNSIMEGLGSIGGELKNNSAYVAMIKQLTAAKLNLNATAALLDGATCSDYKDEITGETIQQIIARCDTPSMCGANQAAISGSGCIEALDRFNNSQDSLTVTPSPFDRPPVDDFNKVSGADPSQFGLAQGNGKLAPKLVIGKNVPGGVQCVP